MCYISASEGYGGLSYLCKVCWPSHPHLPLCHPSLFSRQPKMIKHGKHCWVDAKCLSVTTECHSTGYLPFLSFLASWVLSSPASTTSSWSYCPLGLAEHEESIIICKLVGKFWYPGSQIHIIRTCVKYIETLTQVHKQILWLHFRNMIVKRKEKEYKVL